MDTLIQKGFFKMMRIHHFWGVVPDISAKKRSTGRDVVCAGVVDDISDDEFDEPLPTRSSHVTALARANNSTQPQPLSSAYTRLLGAATAGAAFKAPGLQAPRAPVPVAADPEEIRLDQALVELGRWLKEKRDELFPRSKWAGASTLCAINQQERLDLIQARAIQCLFFSKLNRMFFRYLDLEKTFLDNEINNFRGELTDIPAKKEALVPSPVFAGFSQF